MREGKLLRSIVYPEGLQPSPFVLALVLWAGLLFLVPLAPLLQFLLAGRPPFPRWLAELSKFSPIDLTFAEVVLGLWVLLVLLLWLLIFLYLQRAGERERPLREMLLALSDCTSLQRIERWLFLGAPILAVISFLLRREASVEAVLAGGIVLSLVLGSRALPRFPRQEETLLPYSSEELEELFAQPEGNGVVKIEYHWFFKEHPYLTPSPTQHFRFTIPFDESHYQAALEKDHTVHTMYDYARIAIEDFTSPEVVMVAAKLKEIHEVYGYSRFQQACNVLAFTAQFRYAYDRDTKGVEEYPRYPVEMLWDREGDCECHALLAGTLLRLLGLDVILLGIDFAEGPGHVAVGIAGADDMPAELQFYLFEGKRYFYCEATPPAGVTSAESGEWGWSIGVMPFEDVTRVTPMPLALPVPAPE